NGFVLFAHHTSSPSRSRPATSDLRYSYRASAAGARGSLASIAVRLDGACRHFAAAAEGTRQERDPPDGHLPFSADQPCPGRCKGAAPNSLQHREQVEWTSPSRTVLCVQTVIRRTR